MPQSQESPLGSFFARLNLPATAVEGLTQGECWTFPVGPCAVYVYHLGSTLLLSASLGQAPTAGVEPFYRRLLKLNTEAGLLGSRLGIEPGGTIKLTQVVLLGQELLEFEQFRANLEGFMRGMRLAGESIVEGLAEIRESLAGPGAPGRPSRGQPE